MVPNPYLMALATKRRGMPNLGPIDAAVAGLPPLPQLSSLVHRPAGGGLDGLKEPEYPGVAPEDAGGAMPAFPRSDAFLPPLQVPPVSEPALHINQPIDTSGMPPAFQGRPYEAPVRDRRGMEKAMLLTGGLGLLFGGGGGALSALSGTMQGYNQAERDTEKAAFERWQQEQERGRAASGDELRRWEANVRAQEAARAGDRAYNQDQLGLYRARLEDRDQQLGATLREREGERSAMSDAAENFERWREAEAKRKQAEAEFKALLPVKQANAEATRMSAGATLKRAEAYRDDVNQRGTYQQGQLGVAKKRVEIAGKDADTRRMGAVTAREGLRWKRQMDRVNAGKGSRKDVEETIGKLLADAADMEKAIPRARKEMVMDPKTRTMRETEGTEWVKPPADATKAAAQLRANAEAIARKNGLKIVARRDGTRFTVPLAGRR